MRQTSMIFIEGLPGSGKTTTANWLATRLREEGRTVALFGEHHPEHPLNVGGAIHPSRREAGFELFERYTPESFVQESLERWRSFVEETERSGAVALLDSYPFQSAIRVLMQLNADAITIDDYAARIEEMTMPLGAALIYFHHHTVTDALNTFGAITAQRGPEWAEYMMAMMERSPFAIARGLTGPACAIVMLGEYKSLIERLLRLSQTPRIMLEDCAGDWDGCYRKIEEFLGLG